jgi:bile acid-coenzyme A ligase
MSSHSSSICSYGRALARHASRDPGAIALIHEGRATTYRELEENSNRLARAYADRGVVEGDFVTISLPNGRRAVESFFACWKLGATPQPVSSRLPLHEREAIIELVNPRLIVGEEAARDDGPSTLEAAFEPSAYAAGPLVDRVSRYRFAICSGGSTGRPKVIVDHIPAQADPEASFHGMAAGASILVPGPLYHSGPLINCLTILLGGGMVVLMSRFDAREALALIVKHRLQLAIFVPTMLLRIWKLPEDERNAFDLSSLHRVVSSSASLPNWLQREWIAWIGADRVWEAYGGSERIGGTIISGTEWLEKPGSVGRVSEGRQLKIMDPDGIEMLPGEVGDIYCLPAEGPGSTYHYLGATPARLADGWETLGDMGTLDEDGYLFLVDRRTDLIISGGSNIYPAEVEGAVESHPDVLSCAAIGLPDDDLGAVVHAIVETEAELSADALRSYLGDRLVRYKIPRSFEFVRFAIKDDAGKVRRGALRDARLSDRVSEQ